NEVCRGELEYAHAPSLDEKFRQFRSRLRQRDALEGTYDVVRAFFGGEAFVIAGAKVPRRTLGMFVAKDTQAAAIHDHAAHTVVPVIADVVETQIGAGIGTFKTDVVVKYDFRQPNNFLVRLSCDLACTRRVIAQWPQAPFHVDDAPVIGRQFNFR